MCRSKAEGGQRCRSHFTQQREYHARLRVELDELSTRITELTANRLVYDGNTRKKLNRLYESEAKKLAKYERLEEDLTVWERELIARDKHNEEQRAVREEMRKVEAEARRKRARQRAQNLGERTTLQVSAALTDREIHSIKAEAKEAGLTASELVAQKLAQPPVINGTPGGMFVRRMTTEETGTGRPKTVARNTRHRMNFSTPIELTARVEKMASFFRLSVSDYTRAVALGIDPRTAFRHIGEEDTKARQEYFDRMEFGVESKDLQAFYAAKVEGLFVGGDEEE